MYIFKSVELYCFLLGCSFLNTHFHIHLLLILLHPAVFFGLSKLQTSDRGWQVQYLFSFGTNNYINQ